MWWASGLRIARFSVIPTDSLEKPERSALRTRPVLPSGLHACLGMRGRLSAFECPIGQGRATSAFAGIPAILGRTVMISSKCSMWLYQLAKQDGAIRPRAKSHQRRDFCARPVENRYPPPPALERHGRRPAGCLARFQSHARFQEGSRPRATLFFCPCVQQGKSRVHPA